MFDPSGPVLGIDPGLSRCGYGAVDGAAGAGRAVAYGVLRTAGDDPLPDRLARLATDLEDLVATLSPRAVAVERVLFQTNARTAISVGQASGLALVAAARVGIPVVQYSPNEVKLAVAGYGGADKEQVQRMVARLLGLSEVPRPADAADALALALCHLGVAPLRTRVDAAARAAARTAAGTATGTSAPTGFDRAVAAALAKESSERPASSSGASRRASSGIPGTSGRTVEETRERVRR